MRCFICSGASTPYFSKNFAGECGLGRVEYWRCGGCGVVVSKSHFDMPEKAWKTLNQHYHAGYQWSDSNRDDPRWLSRLHAQRDNLVHLADAGLLPHEFPWIDYGCGDGKLADMLGERQLPTFKYDKFMPVDGPGAVGDEMLNDKFGVVISTCVFEHVRAIESLDEVAHLVDQGGALAFHTMVRESIPNDPSWFYLVPVHTVFFTNRSMQILFDRWKFVASIYHVPSRMWFAFRQEPAGLAEFVARQRDIGVGDFHYKRGFVDFWRSDNQIPAAGLGSRRCMAHTGAAA